MTKEKLQPKEEGLNGILFQLWRNYPQGVSTFGPCSRKCGPKSSARGAGVCAACLEKDLAALVGEVNAGSYHFCVRAIRRMEREFEDILSNPKHE